MIAQVRKTLTYASPWPLRLLHSSRAVFVPICPLFLLSDYVSSYTMTHISLCAFNLFYDRTNKSIASLSSYVDLQTVTFETMNVAKPSKTTSL